MRDCSVMTDLLRTLPREVFLLILDELPKADLKSLSRVSRWLRDGVAESLWNSITIRAWDETRLSDIQTSGLPQSSLKHAKKLYFLAEFKQVKGRRCPHYDAPCSSLSPGLNTDDNMGRRDVFHFDRLVRKAHSLLKRIKPGQLQSFSWNLGVCGPADIFGYRGILSLQQPLLRTLSLITDPTCIEHHAALRGRHIDLSSFHQLRNLTWRGPGPENLNTLSDVVRNNSAHLRKLELDFVNRFIVFNYDADATDVSDDSDDSDNSDVQDETENTRVTRKRSVFASVVLRLNHHPQRPLFRNICVLSLTQVPLSAYMAGAFNFDTLESLTLRMCPWWDVFLVRVMQLNLPIKLRAFEIVEDSDIAFEWGDGIISDFLNVFGGLEELCVSQTGPAPALDLWEILGCRHPTLKRFVHHQRSNEIDDVFQRPTDLPDLAVVGSDMRRIKEDPSRNPLTKLGLEFIGLACIPARLKYLLLPFTSKTSLKAIHIRQTRYDRLSFGSWAAVHDNPPLLSAVGNDTSSDSDLSTSTDDEPLGPNMDHIEDWRRRVLSREFSHFAEWAFGPRGIPSLDVIVFGDFSYGGRLFGNLMISRNMDGTGNSRVIEEGEYEWNEVLDKYGTMMEACPEEEIFDLV